MTEELEALIVSLECLDLGALLEDPTLMAVGLEERENLIQHLQTIDLTAVPSVERARLKPRLQKVIERDAEILGRVQEARDEVAAAVGNLVSGRALVRGYGGPASSGEATMKRVG